MVVALILWLVLVLDGASPARGVARGSPAKVSEFPFVAAVVRRTGLCTAIILTEDWLLTAAHCYHSMSRSSTNPFLSDVYAGTVETTNCGVMCQHRESHIAFLHPHYRAAATLSRYDDARHNDLALLRLQASLYLGSPFVGTAIRSSAPTAIRSCTVVGFGLGNIGTFGFEPGRLLKAENVPVLPAKLCPRSHYDPLPGASLCSDTVIGVAPCVGDAGGPVICDGLVVGISVGVYKSRWEYSRNVFYCGVFKSCSFFGLYSALEPFESWIDGIMFRSPQSPPLNASIVSDPDKC